MLIGVQVDPRRLVGVGRQVGLVGERGEHRAGGGVELAQRGGRPRISSIVRIMLTVLYCVLSRCFRLV